MPVVTASIVATAIVAAPVIASISAVPIGIAIVSGPGAGTIYHRRSVDGARRRIDNRWTGIHGARHTDADADRYATGLREADPACAQSGCNHKPNELEHLRSPRLESVRITNWFDGATS